MVRNFRHGVYAGFSSLHRQGAFLSNFGGKLHGFGFKFVGRHDFVDKSEPFSFSGRNNISGQDHFKGFLAADMTRQGNRRTQTDQSHVDGGGSEPRIFGSHCQITGKDKTCAVGHCSAFYRSYHRLFHSRKGMVEFIH